MKDEKLIDAISKGDESAIKYIIEKYSKLLWSVVLPILETVSSEEDAEECIADVFIYLWEQPSRFDSSKGSLKSWLCMVARSKAIDRYRRAIKNDCVSLDEETLLMEMCEEDKAFSRLAEREMLSDFTEAFCKLNELQKEILRRRYCYDQKPQKIAAAMNMPVKQVKNQLYGTKKKLRDAMERR